MKHKHAELMAQYAQDALETDCPWERWEYCDEFDSSWEPLTTNPKWFLDYQYRRKPKVISINGIDVPEPERGPLKYNQDYYIPVMGGHPSKYAGFLWKGNSYDHIYLKRGIVHSTFEAAEIHAQALLSFTEKK